MAIPTSYTPRSFSQYCARVLGNTADVMGWETGQDDDSPGDYLEVLDNTLFLMGLSDITEVDTGLIFQFRTLARVNLWMAVAANVAGDYTFSADGGSYSRDQVMEHAERMLAIAKSDAAQFDPLYAAIEQDVSYKNDPYSNYDDQLTEYIEDL